MTDSIRILKQGNCQSLSGRSELAYDFGYDEKAKTILFRISGNSGEGHFQESWVPLDGILKCLQEAKEPFSLGAFKTLYPGQSVNNLGFLGAAMKHEGLIVCEKRQYLRKGDPKVFLAEIGKLTKSAKKTKAPAATLEVPC